MAYKVVDSSTYNMKIPEISDINGSTEILQYIASIESKLPFVMTASINTTDYTLSNPNKSTQNVIDALNSGVPVFCICSGSSGTYTKHLLIQAEYSMVHNTPSNSYVIFSYTGGTKHYSWKFKDDAFASPLVTTYQTV